MLKPETLDISAHTWGIVFTIVQRELLLVDGLNATEAEMGKIAENLCKVKLAAKKKESSLPQSFESTRISERINGLQDALKGFRITLPEIFNFFSSFPNFLRFQTPELKSRVRLMADLLQWGDLPAPDNKAAPATVAAAIRVVFNNGTYRNMATLSDSQIVTIALYTSLSGKPVNAAFERSRDEISRGGNRKKTKEDRDLETCRLVQGATEAAFLKVADLAKRVYETNPPTLTEERRALLDELANRLRKAPIS